ncbi:hypothetical protein [Streptomyces sp. NPDC007100]|uniref:hypothetical protein n=1 Tax=Streptomyces sp. NPDC007100 TaxID=3155602 RepID=UPI0033C14242
MTYDLLVTMNQSTLNSLVKQLHDIPGAAEKLFKGKMKVPVTKTETSEFQWALEQEPYVNLSVADDLWKKAISPKGKPPEKVTGALHVRLPKLRVTGPNIEDQVRAVDVICSLTTRADALAFTPLGAAVDLQNISNANDRMIYRHVIVPKALQASLAMVGTIALPHLDVAGVSFGNFALAAGSGRIAGAANMADKAPATTPDPSQAADVPFEIHLSPAAAERAINHELAKYAGAWETTKGSTTFGIGRAEYEGGMRATQLYATVDTSDPLQVTATLHPEAYGNAGVDLFSEIGHAIEQIGESIGRALSSY